MWFHKIWPRSFHGHNFTLHVLRVDKPDDCWLKNVCFFPREGRSEVVKTELCSCSLKALLYGYPLQLNFIGGHTLVDLHHCFTVAVRGYPKPGEREVIPLVDIKPVHFRNSFAVSFTLKTKVRCHHFHILHFVKLSSLHILQWSSVLAHE